jgi:formylglycine-generating enzyme required for sulfatase activity
MATALFAAMVLIGCGSKETEAIDTDGGVHIEMVFVEGGTLTLGYTPEQKDDFAMALPHHCVTVGDFHIGKYEVTQKQWFNVMGTTVSWQRDDADESSGWLGELSPLPEEGDSLPMSYVSWTDVQEFIVKLNFMTGKTYRLPTEDEWEFAARGGTKSNGYKYSGSNNLTEVAWYYENSGDNILEPPPPPHLFGDVEIIISNNNRAHHVGSKQPNELGIYDMSGNVWEWVNDVSLSIIDEDNWRIVRGGSWYHCPSVGHPVSFRLTYRPIRRNNDLGFRLALSQTVAEVLSVDGNAVKTHKIAAKPAIGKKKPKLVARDSDSGKAICDIAMVFVEGGTFTMGCTAEWESECKNDEKPPHDVTVGDFHIGKYEVTQEIWKQVMGTEDFQQRYKDYMSALSLYEKPLNEDANNLPMSYVNWNDVREFIVKLNTMTGKKYRLPTEAEWEFAARGGKKSKGYKYSGGNNITEVAWYADNSDNCKHPVGTKQPNELGIYDMSGNVEEWINDRYDKFYYTTKAKINPEGSVASYDRVVRGGSGYESVKSHRVSARSSCHRSSNVLMQGFRLALSP